MITITKRFEFDYAHHLPRYPGKCANLHGHRGILEITISGGGGLLQRAKYTSMVMDFGLLKSIINDKIIDKVDHKNMNDLLEIPTAENFVRWVRNELKNIFEDDLIRIRFYETPDCWAEWEKE